MRVWAILGFLSLMLCVGSARGESLIPREHHEWGRFPVGSWKKVRLVTEELNADWEVISTNSRIVTTTVSAVNNNSVELKVETAVELAGKEFPKEPKLVRQDFGGDVEPAPDEARLVKHLGSENVEIEGQPVESEVSTITIRRDRCRLINRIHYCRHLAPYVLRREITAEDLDEGVTRYETTVEVIAVNMPHEIKGETRPTSHIRTVHTTNKGKTTTLEVRCEAVPGGFISHTSEHKDDSGRVVQRSRLELIDYQVPKTEKARPRIRPAPPSAGRWQRYYYRSWRTN